MRNTHTIEFYDADGEVIETAVYVCNLHVALSAAAERAELNGADDYDIAPRVGDEDAHMECAA